LIAYNFFIHPYLFLPIEINLETRAGLLCVLSKNTGVFATRGFTTITIALQSAILGAYLGREVRIPPAEKSLPVAPKDSLRGNIPISHTACKGIPTPHQKTVV
jgi:hypothetical protein